MTHLEGGLEVTEILSILGSWSRWSPGLNLTFLKNVPRKKKKKTKLIYIILRSK